MSCRSISRCKGDIPPFLFVDKLSAPNVLFNFTKVFKCTVCILFRLCLQLIDNSSACCVGLLFFFSLKIADRQRRFQFLFAARIALLICIKRKKKKTMKVRRTYRQVDTISDHTYTEPHTDMLEDPAYVNIYWTVS